MKIWKLMGVMALVMAVALAWPRPAAAQNFLCARYVTGGNITLQDGESVDGNLCVLGGNARLEQGSQVDGDVMLMGGNLSIDGRVTGDVIATGGLVSLEDQAVIEGDVNVTAARLQRSSGAQVEGSVNTTATGWRGTFPLILPNGVRIPSVDVRNPFWEALWLPFRSFLWAILAVLAVLFLPRHTERVMSTVTTQPIIAGGVGLLTLMVMPIILVVIAITLIGIPVSLLGVMLLFLVWAFGLIAVGTEVGQRIASLIHQDWALALSAGLGTALLTLVLNGMRLAIPCLGWVPAALVGFVGLGAVLLTLGGTRTYPPGPAAATIIPAPTPAAPAGRQWPPDEPPQGGAQVYPGA